MSLATKYNPPRYFMPLFCLIILAGLVYVGIQLNADLAAVPALNMIPLAMLGLALFIALGFEFVNGFHDTANAVATVIYTNALPPHVAVIWSGIWNFLGVMAASGLVAFGILALLPIEMILNVGTGNGFAMVFAMLIAAILWNIGTWAMGLPASSSHTLIGSIIGVGIMNQFLAPAGVASSGVDMAQVIKVAKALIFSPLIGFVAAALLLLLFKLLIKKPELYQPPVGETPPPLWIRSMLIITCTGVSFAHGSNDGQKGMGLIMLILIGIVPMAYSLNHAMSKDDVKEITVLATQASQILAPNHVQMNPAQARQIVTTYMQTHEATPELRPALAGIADDVGLYLAQKESFESLSEAQTKTLRNDLYLSHSALKSMDKAKLLTDLSADQQTTIKAYRGQLEDATQFIPLWVKVSVALALGMGTMVGWRRVVTTVGERIGKAHLTYGQGAAAELTAMVTIFTADKIGLPVSTTQVVSSSIAGTMAANGSGLQTATIRNILLAWVLTFPACVGLSAGLYWLFSQLV